MQYRTIYFEFSKCVTIFRLKNLKNKYTFKNIICSLDDEKSGIFRHKVDVTTPSNYLISQSLKIMLQAVSQFRTKMQYTSVEN